MRCAAGQESFGNRSTRLPRRKPGSIVPPHELVVVGKLLQLLEKFGASEPWVPAFAGKTGAEVANFFISTWILAQPLRFSAPRLLAVRQPLQAQRDRVLVNTSRYPASSPNRGTPSERAAVASIASRVASGRAFLTANSR
jgi:hypothetical protein